MPTFIKKPVPVQATKFIERDFEHWEPWVQNAYNKKEWSYRFDPETGLPNGFVVKGSIIDGGAGDYLVRYPGTPVKIWPGKEFEEKFEKMEVIEGDRVERA